MLRVFMIVLATPLSITTVAQAAADTQRFTVDRFKVSHVSGGEIALDDRRRLAFTADRNLVGAAELRPTVSVVDTRADRQVGSIELWRAPWADVGAGVLVPHVPSGVDTDPSRGLVVTTNSATGTIAIVGIRQRGAQARDIVPVGRHPFGVELDEQRGLAYVASYADDRIDVVDLRRRRVVDTIGGLVAPTKLALDVRRGRLYAGNFDRSGSGRHELAVIDTRSRAIVARVPVDANSRPAVDPVDGTVYAASFATGRVAFVEPAMLTIRATAETGTTPHGVGVDARRGHLYLPNLLAGTVTVLDRESHEVTATLAIAGAPLGVAVDVRTGRAWVSLRDASELAVIEPR